MLLNYVISCNSSVISFSSGVTPSSFVINLNDCELWGEVGVIAHGILNKLVNSRMNSREGIHVALDSPYTKDLKPNITRPAVLRQYFGAHSYEHDNYKHYAPRFTYGGGIGSSCKTVGTIDSMFVTREFTANIDLLSKRVHEIVFSKDYSYNRFKNEGKDTVKVVKDQFNHCTVLMYYGIDEVKKTSKLGLHSDCVYSKDGVFKTKQNSQKENSLTVSLTLGDSRVLRHYERSATLTSKGSFGKWIVNEEEWIETLLTEGTLMVIHPYDERPSLSKRNSEILSTQLQHGKVQVKRDQWSCAIVFRTVTNVQYYSKVTDKIIAKNDAHLIKDIADVNNIHSNSDTVEKYESHISRIQHLYKKKVEPKYRRLIAKEDNVINI